MTRVDFDLTYQLVDRSLRLAAHVEAATAQAMNELGLSAPLANLLWQIDPDQPPTMGQLASLRYVDKATITGLVAKLEARGFVARQQTSTDRRSRVVVMLAAGKAVRDQLLHAITTATPFATLALSEKHELLELLTKAVPVDPTLKQPWRDSSERQRSTST
ncbi:DNA-binding transcriptional regulator, MarR family [Agrobacterium sp. 719_389]|jgi:DNA-binding MarR family transcriptional regulator|nr:DNA-binding transcriptional regulator, MarR family [Agrobacterium sp. 719_389]